MVSLDTLTGGENDILVTHGGTRERFFGAPRRSNDMVIDVATSELPVSRVNQFTHFRLQSMHRPGAMSPVACAMNIKALYRLPGVAWNISFVCDDSRQPSSDEGMVDEFHFEPDAPVDIVNRVRALASSLGIEEDIRFFAWTESESVSEQITAF